MTLLSSKHFKLFHKKKLTTVNVVKKDYISKLPQELLCCIYQQLETIECQTTFSIVCKSFHKIAMDKRTNASWIVTRYGPRFAIYYALVKYPTRCDQQFIHYLISFGAKPSRYLIQVLIQVYGKPIDNMIKSSEHRTRRSSFNMIDLDLFFLKSIQQLSFDGYAALIQYGFQYYGSNINIHQDDLTLLLSDIQDIVTVQDLICDKWFFPAPLLQHPSNYRQLLKLAYTQPKLYNKIAPLFDFDPMAKSALWEAILYLFFDESFKSTEPTQEKEHQLKIITEVVKEQRVDLLGPLNDQQLFCQVFANFFIKYPVGYCHQTHMSKLLKLLKLYITPNFNIHLALEHMVQANIGRSDTIQSLDTFLKQQ